MLKSPIVQLKFNFESDIAQLLGHKKVDSVISAILSTVKYISH